MYGSMRLFSGPYHLCATVPICPIDVGFTVKMAGVFRMPGTYHYTVSTCQVGYAYERPRTRALYCRGPVR